ncbi:hypothetical protein FKM82_019012 [Ascaphus truei]
MTCGCNLECFVPLGRTLKTVQPERVILGLTLCFNPAITRGACNVLQFKNPALAICASMYVSIYMFI